MDPAFPFSVPLLLAFTRAFVLIYSENTNCVYLPLDKHFAAVRTLEPALPGVDTLVTTVVRGRFKLFTTHLTCVGFLS